MGTRDRTEAIASLPRSNFLGSAPCGALPSSRPLIQIAAVSSGSQDRPPWAAEGLVLTAASTAAPSNGTGRGRACQRTPSGDVADATSMSHDRAYMHGNVWEWVEDCWNDNYRGAPGDGTPRTGGNCSGHVLRGGSWSNDPRILRSANRNGDRSDSRHSNAGFRVARVVSR